MSRALILLLYHGVGADDHGARMAAAHPRRAEYMLTQPQFEAHLTYLADSGLSVTRLEDVPQNAPPMPTVVLTFDDGEASCYHTIAPMLERYRLRGEFFIVSRLIGTPGYVTAEQLRDMARRGHGVHSHSASHALLPALDRARITEEMRSSKRELEALTGREVQFFSIPNGAYDARVLEEARRTGYRGVLNSVEGYNFIDSELPFLLKRFAMRAYTPVSELRAICTDLAATTRRVAVKRAVLGTCKTLFPFGLYDKVRDRVISTMMTARRRG